MGDECTIAALSSLPREADKPVAAASMTRAWSSASLPGG